MELAPGSAFAGYTVVRPLGRGGMGQVYLVENPALARREALKVVSADGARTADFTARFTREAQTAASLRHPNIVTVYAYGTHDDSPWFTMAHVDGHDLTEAGLTHADVLDVAQQTTSALDYAHRRGVIHRDIKPANIFLTRGDDGELAVTVLDFGIAKLSGTTRLTGTDLFIGTLEYSAPELLGDTEATPAADQYSLACTLYEILAGTPPFTAPSVAALIRAQSLSPAPLLSSHRPDLAALDPVFARALAKNPADRFPSCRAFAAALVRATDLGRRSGEPARGGAARPSPPRPHRPTLPPNAAPAARISTSDGRPASRGPVRPNISPRVAPGLPIHPAPPIHAAPPGDTARSHGRRRALRWGAVIAVVLLAAAAAIYVVTRPGSGADSATGNGATAIATSGSTACMISHADLYCWGENNAGQLGDGTTVDRHRPVRVTGLSNVTAVAVGSLTTCAISDGAVYCWGHLFSDSGSADRHTPARFGGLANANATAVVTDGNSTCAVSEGIPYCLGLNSGGEIGDGTRVSRGDLVRVKGLADTTAITASSFSACAVSGGAAYCWGDTHLGEGTGLNTLIPVRVPDLTEVTAITTGGYKHGQTCAIAGGALFCWGWNKYGQLGNGTLTDKNTPTRVDGLTDVTAVTTTGNTFRSAQTCAVADATPYCWGSNDHGQLGDGTTAQQSVPTRVNGLTNVTAIATADSSTCAVADGDVYCWGSNDHGQLGDGTTIDSLTPRRVELPR